MINKPPPYNFGMVEQGLVPYLIMNSLGLKTILMTITIKLDQIYKISTYYSAILLLKF